MNWRPLDYLLHRVCDRGRSVTFRRVSRLPSPLLLPRHMSFPDTGGDACVCVSVGLPVAVRLLFSSKIWWLIFYFWHFLVQSKQSQIKINDFCFVFLGFFFFWKAAADQYLIFQVPSRLHGDEVWTRRPAGCGGDQSQTTQRCHSAGVVCYWVCSHHTVVYTVTVSMKHSFSFNLFFLI